MNIFVAFLDLQELLLEFLASISISKDVSNFSGYCDDAAKVISTKLRLSDTLRPKDVQTQKLRFYLYKRAIQLRSLHGLTSKGVKCRMWGVRGRGSIDKWLQTSLSEVTKRWSRDIKIASSKR
ncbi:hypothetical protein J6590_040524, partial [Homalodisca vitripennis]